MLSAILGILDLLLVSAISFGVWRYLEKNQNKLTDQQRNRIATVAALLCMACLAAGSYFLYTDKEPQLSEEQRKARENLPQATKDLWGIIRRLPVGSPDATRCIETLKRAMEVDPKTVQAALGDDGVNTFKARLRVETAVKAAQENRRIAPEGNSTLTVTYDSKVTGDSLALPSLGVAVELECRAKNYKTEQGTIITFRFSGVSQQYAEENTETFRRLGATAEVSSN